MTRGRNSRHLVGMFAIFLMASCGMPGASAPLATPTPVSMPSSSPPRAPTNTPVVPTATSRVPGTSGLGSIDLSQAEPIVAQFAAPSPGNGPPPDLTDVSFVTAEAGFGVTYYGGIYRTSDGGASWQQLHQLDSGRFARALFHDASTGFVIGSQACTPEPYCPRPAVLLSTTDGGVDWRAIQPEAPMREIAANLPYLNVVFASAEVGYAVPDHDRNGALPQGLAGRILTTDDGGQHWRYLPLPDGFSASGGLSFLGPGQGYVTGYRGGTGDYQVLATSDGGQRWQVLYSDPAFPLYAVDFLNPRQGFAGGGWGSNPDRPRPPTEALLGTEDGGMTWQTVYRHDDSRGGAPITRLQFSSPTVGWSALGGCNRMGEVGPCSSPPRLTRDGGHTWAGFGPQSTPHFSSVGTSAWLVGTERVTPGPNALYRTADGQNWQVVRPIPAPLDVNRVQFASPRAGWINTSQGFFATTDGGEHWAPYPLGKPVTGWDQLVFLSPEIALAYKGDYQGGGLLRSDDGGQSWQPAPLPALPSSVDRHAATLASAGPQGGRLALGIYCKVGSCPDFLFATSDAGRTWQQRTAGLPARAFALRFGDGLHGAALGREGGHYQLMLTVDGGQTWSIQPLAGLSIDGEATGANALGSLSYVGARHIWLAGSTPGTAAGRVDGVLIHSADGGQHWTIYRSDTLRPDRVHFSTPLDGWMIARVRGYPGNLFVTRDGGQTWQQVRPALPQ